MPEKASCFSGIVLYDQAGLHELVWLHRYLIDQVDCSKSIYKIMDEALVSGNISEA